MSYTLVQDGRKAQFFIMNTESGATKGPYPLQEASERLGRILAKVSNPVAPKAAPKSAPGKYQNSALYVKGCNICRGKASKMVVVHSYATRAEAWHALKKMQFA